MHISPASIAKNITILGCSIERLFSHDNVVRIENSSSQIETNSTVYIKPSFSKDSSPTKSPVILNISRTSIHPSPDNSIDAKTERTYPETSKQKDILIPKTSHKYKAQKNIIQTYKVPENIKLTQLWSKYEAKINETPSLFRDETAQKIIYIITNIDYPLASAYKIDSNKCFSSTDIIKMAIVSQWDDPAQVVRFSAETINSLQIILSYYISAIESEKHDNILKKQLEQIKLESSGIELISKKNDTALKSSMKKNDSKQINPSRQVKFTDATKK